MRRCEFITLIGGATALRPRAPRGTCVAAGGLPLVAKTCNKIMRGKTVVITGGTAGIGEVAAEILAKKGARIVLVARDKIRGEATLARLQQRAWPRPLLIFC